MKSLLHIQVLGFALVAAIVTGCGSSMPDINPNDLGKVVIGNNAVSPQDEPPLVLDSNGVLVHGVIPGAPIVVEPPPVITYKGLAQ